MKLPFTHPASPPIRNAEQFVQHLRNEAQSFSTLQADSAIALSPSDADQNRFHLTLSLSGLRLNAATLAHMPSMPSHSEALALHLESLSLKPSEITLCASDGTACVIQVSGSLTAPTIELFDQDNTTVGGALTRFRSATLALVLPKTFDRLVSCLLPEVVLKQTGVSVRDVIVRSEPSLDCLNLFLSASVKAFVMNASGRASASIVRENEHLFLRDLQAHTDAAMLSSLLSGYVKSFASQLAEKPLPLSICGQALRCTALSPTAKFGVQACFEAP